MNPEADTNSRVTYQFRADRDTWQTWKETVPRSTSLSTRIQELIQADIDERVAESNGRVVDPSGIDAIEGAVDDVLAAVDARDRDAAEDAVERIREVIQA